MIFLRSWNAASCNPIRIVSVYLLFTFFCGHVFGFVIVRPTPADLTTKRYPAIYARDSDAWTIVPRADGPTLADIPSLDRLRQAVEEQSESIASLAEVDPDDLTTIFYTNNPLSVDEIECWAAKVVGENKFVTFENAVSPEDAFTFEKKVFGKPQARDLYQKQLSRVIAEKASGDVILLIPAGVEPKAQSTWQLYEFPAIQHDNPNHVTVYRLDPSGKDDPIQLWETGDAITLPPPLDTLPPGDQS